MIGLDIGGTKIAGAVFDVNGVQLDACRDTTPADYESLVRTCVELVAALENKLTEKASVGIGLPGMIHHHKGTVIAANLPFMTDKPFRSDMSLKLGRPVMTANDANCLALAEAIDGAGKGASSVLGLIMGTGIGSGFINQGKIIDGPNGIAGEIGHLPLPFREFEDGTLVACGCKQKDCIEKAIAGPALARLYAFITGEAELDAKDIADHARAGDSKALKVLDRYYEIVAKAMILPLYAYDPEVIVVSGGLNTLPGLYEEVPKRWSKYTFFGVPKTRFVQAVHGPMAGLRGAAYLGRI